MNSISSHGAEVRPIRKLLLKYNNMNREELKRLWFSLPKTKPVKEIKAVVVEKHGDNHYSCERKTQTDAYWSSSSANFNTFEQALERANSILSDDYYEGYELIIK